MKILIADSDQEFLNRCKLIMSSWGHEVVTCNSVNQVLNECWCNNIDLSILSVIFEDTNGFELSRQIKKTVTLKPVLFWTDQPSGFSFIKSKKLENNLVISKSIENQELKNIIEARVSNYREKCVLRSIAELEINYLNTKRFIELSNTISLGRSKDCDVRFISSRISSIHLMLIRMFEDSRSFYRIVDGEIGGRSSLNGTVVNKLKLNNSDYVDLKHGDVINIPEVTMVYRELNKEKNKNNNDTQT